LVYASDVSDPPKQRIAQTLVTRAVAGELIISTQVLAEFAATLLYKLAPPVPAQDVVALLDALGPIRLIAPDGDIVRRAVEAHAKYGLHFYDGMILAAAWPSPRIYFGGIHKITPSAAAASRGTRHRI
jgi:predicted nucleic acid-binding protein